ncbi:GNAT family N-acetyltransferase [Pigmentibacter sp. JX0631]|uniref:GNAT family N-acetyltransferase n=1 Tax=Pigmentibacter sp. JX0631 TaxID=2976982 RepID=UPI0024685A58|nr:GNAT family N-acetyltransferase [Pigmentibacter sp. JX0631]WGL59716.1 GNAT family N-acetyltransferase [Pigmentibacter sp. JX0631]
MQNLIFPDLKIVQNSDLEKATRTLLLAFEHDPCLRYLLNNSYPEREAKFIHNFVLKTGLEKGKVYTTSENVEGVAVWLPPESIKLSWFDFIKFGGLKIPLKHILKMNTYDLHAKKIHNSVVKSPHWYLLSLSVQPIQQGKSLGTKMLKPMLEFFDMTKQSCYLETHNQKNIPFYEKNGFKIMSITKLPNSDTNHYSMLRHPK